MAATKKPMLPLQLSMALLLSLSSFAVAAQPKLNPIFTGSASGTTILAQLDIAEKVEESLVPCRPMVTDFANAIQPCDRVAFGEAMLRLAQEHKDAVSSGAGAGKKSEIDRVASPLFQDFFNTYSLPGTPVVITGESFEGLVGTSAGDEPFKLLEDCAGNKDEASLPLDCPFVVEEGTHTVPKYVASDYLQRLPNPREGESDMLKVLKRWPTLLKPATSTRLHQCEFGANMLLLALQSDLKIAVYERSQTHWLHESPGRRWSKPSLSAANANKAASSTATLAAGELLFAPGGSIVSISAVGAGALVMQYCYVDASNFPYAMSELFFDALVDAPARKAYHHFLYSRRADPHAEADSAAGLGSSLFSPVMDREPELDNQTWTRFRAWPRHVDKAALAIRMRARKKKKKDAFKKWQEEKKFEALVFARTLPPPLVPDVTNVGRRNVTLHFTNPSIQREADDAVIGYRVSWLPEARDGSGKAVGAASHIDVDDKDTTRVATAAASGGKEKETMEVTLSSLESNTTYSFSVAVYMGSNEDTTFGPPSLRSAAHVTMAEGVPAAVAEAPTLTLEQGKPVVSPNSLSLNFLVPFDDGGASIEYYLMQVRKHGKGFVRHQRLLRSAEGNEGEKGGEGAEKKRDAEAWTVADHERDSHYDHNLRIKPTQVAIDGRRSVPAVVPNLVPNTSFVVRVAAVNSFGRSPWSPPSEPLRTSLPTGWAEADAAGTRRPGSDTVGGAVLGAVLGIGHEQFPFHHDGYDTRKLGVIAHLFDGRQELMVSPLLHHGSSGGNASDGSGGGGEAPFIAETWHSHHNPGHHDVIAEVVVADPPLADAPLANAHEARSRLLLVDRGGVPLLQKARVAQDAGALGVLIADSGACNNTFNQQCVPGADKSRGEGVALNDPAEQWASVSIPVALIHKPDADKIKELIAKEATMIKPDDHVLEKVSGKPYFVYVDKTEQRRRREEYERAQAGGGEVQESMEVDAGGGQELAGIDISVSPAAAAKKKQDEAEAARKAKEEEERKAEEERKKKEEEERKKKAEEEEEKKKAAEEKRAAEVAAGKKADEEREAAEAAAREKAAADANTAHERQEVADAAAKEKADATAKRNEEEHNRRVEAAKKLEEAAAQEEAAAEAAEAAATANSKYKPGDVVEAQYMGSITFYGGAIEAVNPDGTYVVLFDDGDQDDAVPEGNIQLPTPE